MIPNPNNPGPGCEIAGIAAAAIVAWRAPSPSSPAPRGARRGAASGLDCSVRPSTVAAMPLTPHSRCNQNRNSPQKFGHSRAARPITFSATAGSTTSPCAAARMPSRSTGLKSRSSIAMARSPIATVSLPTCRWAPIMSPNSRPAVALAGRSKTRPSTSSRPRDTTSSTISVTASATSPPILVTLNLLAFAMHTVWDIADELWRAARQKLGSRSQFFNNLAAIVTAQVGWGWQAGRL